MTAASWDPALYLGFDDHRSRPFRDLLARVGATAPRRVVDLGCGPGHLTAVLASRWPDADIRALDSSPEMVAAARERGVAAELADVVDWSPPPDTDVVITNAVLQWVPSHPQLVPRWLRALPPGAWFAMQVPGNFGAPSHALIRELLDEPRWRGSVDLRGEKAVPKPAEYAELLAVHAAHVDVWETTYQHRLSGDDPVLRWISATALRPVRDALAADDYAAFRAELAPPTRLAPTAAPGSPSAASSRSRARGECPRSPGWAAGVAAPHGRGSNGGRNERTDDHDLSAGGRSLRGDRR